MKETGKRKKTTIGVHFAILGSWALVWYSLKQTGDEETSGKKNNSKAAAGLAGVSWARFSVYTGWKSFLR